MAKGSKTCVCGTITGPRAFNCPSCGKVFFVKGKQQADLIAANGKVAVIKESILRKQTHGKEIDWQNLVKGDTIKVLSGGPIWPASGEGKEDIPNGYYGIYTVRRVCDDGLETYPLKARTESGLCFIYMGKERVMKSGTIMKPHHIVQVHRRSEAV